MRLTTIQQQLCDLMSDTSERAYFAGWMEGTEFRLWQFVVDPADEADWGLAILEPELRESLKELSHEAGGWIIFSDDDATPRDQMGNSFVPMEDWLDMVEAQRTRRPAQSWGFGTLYPLALSSSAIDGVTARQPQWIACS